MFELRIRIVCYAVMLGFISVVCSCQADNRVVSIGNDIRWVTVHAEYSEPSQDPLSVKAISQVLATYSDTANHTDWLAKVELDFGEGLGWQDFTQQFLDSPLFVGNFLYVTIPHNYAQPGTYTIRIRATFWDGHVVPTGMDSSNSLATVTVPHGS